MADDTFVPDSGNIVADTDDFVVPDPVETGGEEFTPDDPPRTKWFRKSAPKPVTDKAPKRRGRTPALAPRITEAYSSMGALVGMGGTLSGKPGITHVGNALVEIAPDAGKAWQEAAKQYPALADAWERILGTSVAAQLIFAHMPLFLAAFAAANGTVTDTGEAPKSLEEIFSK